MKNFYVFQHEKKYSINRILCNTNKLKQIENLFVNNIKYL